MTKGDRFNDGVAVGVVVAILIGIVMFALLQSFR